MHFAGVGGWVILTLLASQRCLGLEAEGHCFPPGPAFDYHQQCWEPVRRHLSELSASVNWGDPRIEEARGYSDDSLHLLCCQHTIFREAAELCWERIEEHAACCYPELRRRLLAAAPTSETLRQEIAEELDALGPGRLGQGRPSQDALDSFGRRWGHVFPRLHVDEEGVAHVDAEKVEHLRGMSNENDFQVASISRSLRVLGANAPCGLLPLRGLDIFLSANWLDAGPNYSVPVLSATPLRRGRGLLAMPNQVVFFDGPGKFALEVAEILWQYPWQQRKDKLLWRGTVNSAFTRCTCGDSPLSLETLNSQPASTFVQDYVPAGRDGQCICRTMWLTEDNWHLYVRARAALLSMLLPDDLDCAFTAAPGWLNEALDAKMPVQIRRPGDYSSHMPPERYLEYRYALSLTGVHPNQPRAQWLWLTGCVVFFQETPFRDIWFRQALRPFEHYIPVREDLRDLPAKLAWARDHPEETERLRQAGFHFAKEHFTATEPLHYFYRLLQAYRARQQGIAL